MFCLLFYRFIRGVLLSFVPQSCCIEQREWIFNGSAEKLLHVILWFPLLKYSQFSLYRERQMATPEGTSFVSAAGILTLPLLVPLKWPFSYFRFPIKQIKTSPQIVFHHFRVLQNCGPQKQCFLEKKENS